MIVYADKDAEDLKKKLNSPHDLVIKEVNHFSKSIKILFLDTMVDVRSLNDLVLRPLYESHEKHFEVHKLINHGKINQVDDKAELSNYLFNGFALLLVDGHNCYYAFETRSQLTSPIGEAKYERMVKGPKDAFTENFSTNVGLIRRRIKDPNLIFEELTIGRRSRSKVAICYVKDIVQIERVNEIRKRIEKLNIDTALNTNNLMEMISPKSAMTIPSHLTTERPDLVAESLLQGKIAVIMEGTPIASVVPAVITDFLKVPDDWYELGINAMATRIIRAISFFITLFIIPLYIAFVNYNFEIIPVELLMNIAVQRDGLPFPTVIEVMMLLLLFEILRETDLRISSTLGSALSIVGALVIGDAAVSAGIVSPIVVIIVALSAISGMIFNRIEMINGLRWYRIFLIAMASTLGLYGLVIGSILVFFNLSKVARFHVPFVPSLSKVLGFKDPNSLGATSEQERLKRSDMNTSNIRRGEKEND